VTAPKDLEVSATVRRELFNPRQRAVFDLLIEERSAILESAPIDHGYLKPIDNDEQEAVVVALVARAYLVERQAELLRESKVKPLNAEVKAVNATIKDAMGELLARFGKGGEAERILAAYRRFKQDRLRRQADESNRAAQEAAQRQGEAEEKLAAATTVEARAAAAQEVERASQDQMLAELAQPQAMPHGVKTEDGKATWVPVWEVEVVDEAQVPREYLTVDMSKLRAAVKSGARSIPGANIFERESMRRGI
jgi:hypothetical protein